jgi:hypothetical protein
MGSAPSRQHCLVVIAGGHVTRRCTSSCQHGQIIPQRGIVAPGDCGLKSLGARASRTENREPRTKNQEPRTENHVRPWVRGRPEPRTKNREPGTRNQEPRTRNREPRASLGARASTPACGDGGLMEIENLFRYPALAVELKPSAMQGEARLRGLASRPRQRPSSW